MNRNCIDLDCKTAQRAVEHHKASEHKYLSWLPLIGSAALALIAEAASPPPAVGAALFFIAYLCAGYDVLWRALCNIRHGQFFDEFFLMSAATIAALAIGQYLEAVAVMIFYKLGELLLERAVRRSRHSISALLSIKPEMARVLRGGQECLLPPEAVTIGETFRVLPGERIPLDGTILSGCSFVDISSLTGESVPRELKAGDVALAGYVNSDGLLTLKAMRPFDESSLSRVLELTRHAEEAKAPAEEFITRFAKRYTPIVVLLALAISVIPCFFVGFDQFPDYVYRGIVFLVIACPCALVLSIPLAFFGGIGGGSRRGVLFKDGTVLEAMTRVDTLVTDKTGTLTRGVFVVQKIHPQSGVSEGELLRAAALAEANSNHPIARSVLAAYPLPEKIEYDRYQERAGRGVLAVVDGHTYLAGNRRFFKEEGIKVVEDTERSAVLHVACDRRYLGCLLIGDELRPEAREAVCAAKKAGFHRIWMLTGDDPGVALAIQHELALDGCDAGLLPEEKLARLKELGAETTGLCAYIGDGINDAPSLAAADVGIAMGLNGSDVAIEAAGLVIMNDDLTALAAAKQVAAKTRHIVIENVVGALAVKGAILVLAAFGLATIWGAVFADVGVAVLAVLNSGRALNAGK